MGKTHYISGSGEHGCMYDNGPNYHEDLNGAVESLASIFELGRDRKRELKRNRYLELNPRRDGASYCEIQECSCDNPTEHMEPDEIREYQASLEV